MENIKCDKDIDEYEEPGKAFRKCIWNKNKGHHSIIGDTTLVTTIEKKLAEYDMLEQLEDKTGLKEDVMDNINDLLEPDNTPLWNGIPHPFSLELFPIVIRAIIIVVLLTLLISVRPENKKKLPIIYGGGVLFIITDLIVVWVGRHGMNGWKLASMIILTMILVGALVLNDQKSSKPWKYLLPFIIGYIYIYSLMTWVKGCFMSDYPWECDPIELNLSTEEERGIKVKIEEDKTKIESSHQDALDKQALDNTTALDKQALDNTTASDARAATARQVGITDGKYISMINDKIMLNITEPELQKDITLLNQSRDDGTIPQNVILAFIYVKLENNDKRIQFISLKDVGKTYTLTDKGNCTTKTLTGNDEISNWG